MVFSAVSFGQETAKNLVKVRCRNVTAQPEYCGKFGRSGNLVLPLRDFKSARRQDQEAREWAKIMVQIVRRPEIVASFESRGKEALNSALNQRKRRITCNKTG
ncbi:hypothetical protein VTK56DRAFT_761 [Thermocarpiscus australiensis]